MIILDPLSYSESNVSDYVRNYSWPISNAEYDSLCTGILDKYLELVDYMSDNGADILMADTRYLLSIVNLVHVNFVENWVIKNKRNFTGSSCAYFLDQTLKSQLDVTKYDLKKKSLGVARTIYTSFRKTCELNSRSVAKLKYRGSLVLGYPDYIIRNEYLQGSEEVMIWSDDYVFWLAGRLKFTKENDNANLFQVVDNMIEYLISLPTMFTERLPIQNIREAWKSRLSHLENVQNVFYSSWWMNQKSEKMLHMFGSGNTLRKLFGLTAQRADIPLVNYAHGTVGLVYQPTAYKTEIMPWKVIALQTTGIVQSYQESYSPLKIPRQYSRPDYISVRTDSFREVYRSSVDNNVDKCDRKSVILSGFPMVHQRFLDEPGLYHHTRLDLELRIVEDLVNYGYDVSYSLHPGRPISQLYPILEKRGVRVVVDPFEDIFLRYENFVFTYFGTSVLGTTLATNRPIVVFVPIGTRCNPTAFKLLEHRVSTVEMVTTKVNRFDYCSDAFKAALETSKEKSLDRKYFERYLA